MSFLALILLSTLVACALMAITWLFAVQWDNYGIVDAVWSLSFFGMAALASGFTSGWAPRKFLLLAVVGLWSLRLGIFLARRIYGHHPVEDSRYKALRVSYGARMKFRFFLFFQFQALSVVALSIPFLKIALNDAPEFHLLEWLGASLFLFSLLGEALSDAQMNAFKAKPENAGKTCMVGLWRYSRHPNYFFESCIWWSFWIFALGTPGTIFTVYCPLVILFLLLKVTGVPPAEAQAVKKRGQEYLEYQKRTSVFVPWFPKENP